MPQPLPIFHKIEKSLSSGKIRRFRHDSGAIPVSGNDYSLSHSDCKHNFANFWLYFRFFRSKRGKSCTSLRFVLVLCIFAFVLRTFRRFLPKLTDPVCCFYFPFSGIQVLPPRHTKAAKTPASFPFSPESAESFPRFCGAVQQRKRRFPGQCVLENMQPLVNINKSLSGHRNGETPRRGCGGGVPLMGRKKIERRRQKKEGAYRSLSTLSM